MHRLGLALFALFLAVPAIAGLFGSQEYHSRHVARFPKWIGMLARYESGAQDCAHWPCTHAGWKNTVATLRLLPALQQLREVNTRMNAHPYIPDYTGWGVEDFWETPFEFLKKSGDCEDYAIAKYLLLRAIGWPADRLRIAIVRDRNLNIGHAVLIAYLEGVTFVLDNQTGQILPEAQVHQYLPIYSVNEEGWWLHRL